MTKQILIYRLSSQKIGGAIYVTYADGYLVLLDLQLTAPLTPEQSAYLFGHFPYTHAQLEDLNEKAGRMRMELIAMKSVQEKLIAFCSYYKHHRGLPYKATKLEKANLKDVPVDDALLTYFFVSKAWFCVNNYTLSNYIKRINLIRDAARNGLEVAVEFPNKYDPNFERTLSKEQSQEYYRLLRRLGYEYKQTGNGFAWMKKTT